MKWTDLRKHLEALSRDEMLGLIQGLHKLSDQNKRWLDHQCTQERNQDYLEECKTKVARLVYDTRRITPNMPNFREAKKVISEYKKTTRDTAGTLQLMMTYIEYGHAFTNAFGDINGSFYGTLGNAWETFSKELQAHPAAPQLYEEHFRDALLDMRDQSNIGWGYGDLVKEIVGELEGVFS